MCALGKKMVWQGVIESEHMDGGEGQEGVTPWEEQPGNFTFHCCMTLGNAQMPRRLAV